MKEKFNIKPTPSVARRLVRLSEMNSRVVIDDTIRALALENIIPEHDLADLTNSQKELVQDLIDFDLRAIVTLRSSGWVKPVLRAAKIAKISNVVVNFSIPKIEDVFRFGKLEGFSDDQFHPEHKLGEIPRQGLLYLQGGGAASDSFPVAPFFSLSQSSWGIEKTITITSVVRAKTTTLFPGMNRDELPLHKLIGLGFSSNVRDMDYLFQISTAGAAPRV